MPEAFDEYVDQFMISTGPYGVAMVLRRSDPTPPAAGAQPQHRDIGVIRMSLEHLKTMAYILVKNITQIEDDHLGGTIPVSPATLNQLGIPPEDWDTFWRRPE